MGKDSLWKYRWLGPVLHRPRRASRCTAGRPTGRRCASARRCIEQGEPLVMFPEGTRQIGPVVEKVFDGPAYVAARMRVPIVPVGIGGSERAMPKGAKLIRPVKTGRHRGASRS